jgi:hypothetical protein
LEGEVEERSEYVDEYKRFFDAALNPLLSAGKRKQAAALIEDELAREDRPGIRSFHLMTLVGVLTAMGDHPGSLARARQRASEFPNDPLGWSDLAHHFHVALHQPEHRPTTGDKVEALRCWKTALRVAKEQKEFFLMVSFSLCRALTEWEMWPELEQTMGNILEHLDGPLCRHDILNVEGEWISEIPDGKINSDIINRYLSAIG